MYNANQFADLSKTNIAHANKIATIALANAEKLWQLNLETAKAVLAYGIEGAQAVASVKDVQELATLPTKYAESNLQHVVGYSRDLYELSSQAQTELSAVAEEALAGYTQGFAAWVDKAGASAPAGSEVAINAIKSSVAATSAAFDQLQKASKQVVSFADASVRAAADKATKSTVVKGRKAA